MFDEYRRIGKESGPAMMAITLEDIEICQPRANLNPGQAKVPESPASYRVNR